MTTSSTPGKSPTELQNAFFAKMCIPALFATQGGKHVEISITEQFETEDGAFDRLIHQFTVDICYTTVPKIKSDKIYPDELAVTFINPNQTISLDVYLFQDGTHTCDLSYGYSPNHLYPFFSVIINGVDLGLFKKKDSSKPGNLPCLMR